MITTIKRTAAVMALGAACSAPAIIVFAAEDTRNAQQEVPGQETSPNTDVAAARLRVESALDAFARELTAQLPVEAELVESLYGYLEANPEFFGSALALTSTDGMVTHSPYAYRSGTGFSETDLSVPEYGINNQEWFRAPVDTRVPVWTAPYFDAGGGEIWMVTRSVPLIRAGVVIGVVTTDLPVPAP